MLDVKTQVQSALNAILPTQYELFLDDKAPIPSLSYIENMNQRNVDGDTIKYSNIGFTIKLYTYKLSELATYAPQVDAAMYTLGFWRTSSTELKVNSQIIKTLYYECLALENGE